MGHRIKEAAEREHLVRDQTVQAEQSIPEIPPVAVAAVLDKAVSVAPIR